MTGKGPTPVREIDVSGTEEVLSRIQGVTEPLVFRGACRRWPIVERGLVSAAAAADYLRRFDNGVPGDAAETDPGERGRIFFNETITGFNFRRMRLPLGEVLDRLVAEAPNPEPRGLYVYTEVRHLLPGFAAENGAEFAGLGALASLLVSNASCNAAHFDDSHNLPCNLVGERTWTLFPPEQVSNLYPGPMGFSPGRQDICMVDFRAIDEARFPKASAALAAAQRVRLKPGDILFLPAMWWHHVEAHASFNVLMAQWWRDTPEWLGRPCDVLQHAVLSLRDLPKAQRHAWKALFDHYVFEHEDHFPEYLPPHARGPLASPMTEEAARRLRAKLSDRRQR